MTVLQNRYEFVYLFDVTNGNPNGDPDAGNMPRQNFEDQHGIVTDVCIKRKIRNYIDLALGGTAGHDIYVREKAVLNEQHQRAYTALDVDTKNFKPASDPAAAAALTKWMCDTFFDVRTFGAVMTTGVNCGQVRGPLQLTFARSADPIAVQEITVTRMAVTNEKDRDSERTMGRKYVVPYALYRLHGFVSAPLAERSGFTEADLETVWTALANMFDHDRSASRGEMTARGLKVYRHADRLGSTPAKALLDRVTVARAPGSTGPARSFGDYVVSWNRDGLPAGVEAIDRF